MLRLLPLLVLLAVSIRNLEDLLQGARWFHVHSRFRLAGQAATPVRVIGNLARTHRWRLYHSDLANMCQVFLLKIGPNRRILLLLVCSLTAGRVVESFDGVKDVEKVGPVEAHIIVFVLLRHPIGLFTITAAFVSWAAVTGEKSGIKRHVFNDSPILSLRGRNFFRLLLRFSKSYLLGQQAEITDLGSSSIFDCSGHVSEEEVGHVG